MQHFLEQEDIKSVEKKLKEFEAATGCELLLVVAKASDPYPGAALRFGIIGGFLLSLIFSYYWEFHHSYYYPIFTFLLTVFMTWLGHFDFFKRMAMASWETNRECDEKAVELFHTLGVSRVSHKVTAMIMVSVFERNIEVLVDEHLKSKISQSDLDELVSLMSVHFRQGKMKDGLIQSIQTLENRILHSFGGKVSDVNPSELKDTIQFL